MKRRYLAASAAALGAMGLLGVTQVRFANASKAAAAYVDFDDAPHPLLAQAAPEAAPASPTLPAPAASPLPADAPAPQPVPLPPTTEEPPTPLDPLPGPTTLPAPMIDAQPASPQPAAVPADAPDSLEPLPQPGEAPTTGTPARGSLAPVEGGDPESPSRPTVRRRSATTPSVRRPERWAPRPAEAPIPADVPPLAEEARDPFFRRQPAPARVARPSEPTRAVGLPGERSPFELDDSPSTDLDPVFPTPGDRVPGAPAEDGEALTRRYIRKLAEVRSAAASPESDSAIRQMEASIRGQLGQQFDARQRRYVDEIEALEAKVARLRALVDKRQENRDDIVQKRLNQLLSESEGLGW
ncbi:hypothetical protein [Paludisphaera soli]|uniref:hypothetical protein n=1 Tax=Paludisphaera soli TaxID=2712865 RepID=UPI0013EA7F9A|nr:hypothetical protein [Paludisphaera soli]